ncbi:hypothetical protein ASZ90_009425 [hydrocarbon metagenome]|uniref:Uncharacterized protein n=1 Tax=hydrocarbon metagenome TaxID=938273 RepID=A0A0W8FIV2_9ZZZZ
MIMDGDAHGPFLYKAAYEVVLRLQARLMRIHERISVEHHRFGISWISQYSGP